MSPASGMTATPIRRNGGNGGHDPNYQDELITTSSPSHGGQLLFVNAALPVGDAAELYAFGGASRREGAIQRCLPVPVQLLARRRNR